MKKIILIALIIFSFGKGYAQNATNSLKLIVDKNKHISISTTDVSVDVEGYNGDELIIEAITNKIPDAIPAEAKGLKPITLNNRPHEDNTIGYKLTKETNSLYQINITTKCRYLHIKVPNHLYLFSMLVFSKQHDAYLSLKNIEGPLNIEGRIQTINLSHVSGPFKITGKADKLWLSDILWNINAAWSFKPLYSFTAPYLIDLTADIDISIPENLEASLSLRSDYGQIYSDLNQLTENKNNALNVLTLNGGGLSIMANSHTGNIYLRKQKQ